MSGWSWKAVGEKVADAAPLLGAALGGPGGAKLGALISSALGTKNDPGEVAAALGSPETLVKIREIESAERVNLQRMATDLAVAEVNAEVTASAAVNATMQVEAKAEHVMTKTWRPAIGWAVAIAVVLSVLTVFFAFGMALFGNNPKPLESLPGILAAIAGIVAVVSPILGIASWHRGKMQIEEKKA
jgi:hypothetical protein